MSGVVIPLDYLVHTRMTGEADVQLRNRIIWTYGHGEHAKRRFSGRHEVILWYTKGDNYYFDLDSVRVRQKYPGKTHYKGLKRGQPSGNPLGKNPSDVWDIPNVKANHVEKTDHPCQYPVGLAIKLIRALSPEGGRVLDPYAGSGSTGAAAVTEGAGSLVPNSMKNTLALQHSDCSKRRLELLGIAHGTSRFSCHPRLLL